MSEHTLRFSHKEVVIALLKEKNIHEGIWMLDAKFALIGAQVGLTPDDKNIYPAAIIPLIDLGIAKTDKLNPLAVDAAVENPKPKTRARTKKSS